MTHYTITIPNSAWSGKRLGVTIIEGRGSTDDDEIARRLQNDLGYTITPRPPAAVTLAAHKGTALILLVEQEVMDLVRDWDLEEMLPGDHEGVFTFADAEVAFRAEVAKRRAQKAYTDAPAWPWERKEAAPAKAAKPQAALA